MRLVLTNHCPVLLGGPAGAGKSTELAHAAHLLQRHRVACLIQLDRLENMRLIDGIRLMQLIASHVARFATQELQLPLPANLVEESHAGGGYSSNVALVKRILSEVARLSQQGQVALLLDGLDRMPQDSGWQQLAAALANLPTDVDVVAVVPSHVFFGPRGKVIVRAGEQVVSTRALVVDGGEYGQAGRSFLAEVLRRRLHLSGAGFDAAKDDLVADAALISAGIPRTFLQLMSAAAAYADIRRNEKWPVPEELRDAFLDQVDSLRRLLLPGDADAAKAAAGTDGTGLEPARRMRLMSHGILLERVQEEAPMLELLAPAAAAMRGGAGYSTRDSFQTMFTAVERDSGGVAVLWAHDLDEREDRVEEVLSFLLREANPVRTANVEDALAQPSRLALLVPDCEQTVVRDLDASCGRTLAALGRTQPIVVFLILGGVGQRTLAEAAGLVSWVRGRDVDREALLQIDPELAREEFEHKVGVTPDQWLVGWRDGSRPRTHANFQIVHRALLLEQP